MDGPPLDALMFMTSAGTIVMNQAKGYSPVRRWLREERARAARLEDLSDAARRVPGIVARVLMSLPAELAPHQDITAGDEVVYATNQVTRFRRAIKSGGAEIRPFSYSAQDDSE